MGSPSFWSWSDALLCNSSEIRLLWQIELVQERIREKSKEAKIHFTNDTITAIVVKVVSSHEQAATFFIKANKHDGKKPQRNDNIPVSLVNDC